MSHLCGWYFSPFSARVKYDSLKCDNVQYEGQQRMHMGHITGIDHVQVAMPVGAEDLARSFYTGVLGLPEIEKPAVLATIHDPFGNRVELIAQ